MAAAGSPLTGEGRREAILVALSLVVQRGFGSLTHGFHVSQFHQVLSSLYALFLPILGVWVNACM